jgi:serine/threonine protein kinase
MFPCPFLHQHHPIPIPFSRSGSIVMGNTTSHSSTKSSSSSDPSNGADTSIRVSVKSPGLKVRPGTGRDKTVTIVEDQGYSIQPLNDSDPRDSWRVSSRSKKRPNHRKDPNALAFSSISPFSSERSGDSTVSIPTLHGSLLRVHEKRDPLRYYEIVTVLGEGSMGSVSKVTKRASAKGGSARRNFVRREQRHECCFGWFDPENCGRFNLFCPVDKEDEDQHSDILWTDSLKSTEIVTAVSESEGSSSGSHVTSTAARAKQFASFKSSSIITYENKDSFFALKTIRLDQCKDDVLREELINEIAILQRLDHPHIVKALETFKFNDRLYVVLELCSGGDLYARDPYTETQACSIIHDILDAVAYMHARGITHRDLKFENIMFSSPDLDAVKVIDFGLSKKYSQQEHLHDTVGAYIQNPVKIYDGWSRGQCSHVVFFTGTVYTMAPEVLRGDYDQKCDVWSVVRQCAGRGGSSSSIFQCLI